MPVINLALSVIYVGPGLSLAGSTLAVALSSGGSIVPDTNGGLELSGDVLSPGANRVYGTNAGGIKGWYIGSGGGSPGGNTGDIQFNNSGTFGGITPPAGALVGTTATQTLTGKTIDGGNNTLTNIGNASLTHSSYTVGAETSSLGGSISLDGMSSLAIVGLIKRSAANTWVIATAGTDYLVANQAITLSGDITGTGTTVITATVAKVNGVVYGASPATNTVPVVTSTNTITYETVPNAALAHSITNIAGTSVSLGGSISASAILSSIGTTTNILLYYDGGNWSPLTLGTNLSITTGILNASGGGSGSPGGSSGQIQFNNSGAFGGISGLTVNSSTGAITSALSITNASSSTSPTTGALIVTGGAGVSGPMFLGGIVTFLTAPKVLNTSASTNAFLTVSNNQTNQYSYLQLDNSAASGSMWQLAMGGPSTSFAGLFYLYEASTGSTPFQISAIGNAVFAGTIGATSVNLSGSLMATATVTVSNSSSSGYSTFILQNTGSSGQAFQISTGGHDTSGFGQDALYYYNVENGYLMTFSKTGIATYLNSNDTTGVGSGALQIAGGAYIAKNLVSSKGQGWGVTSTATAASTTVLTISSTVVQIFTGSTTQAITLPAANAFGANIAVVFVFKNRSTANIIVNRAGSDTIDGNVSVTIIPITSVTLVSDGSSAWNII